jgi:hypothetical protein
MQPGLPRYFNEAQRNNYERGVASGVAKGKADAVLEIVAERGLPITAEQRHSIVDCTELATVEHWLRRALSACSVAELLASRPSSRTRRRERTRSDRRSK